MVCFNYRSDRMREFAEALGEEPPFDTTKARKVHLTTFTQYKSTFPFTQVLCASPRYNGAHPSSSSAQQACLANSEEACRLLSLVCVASPTLAGVAQQRSLCGSRRTFLNWRRSFAAEAEPKLPGKFASRLNTHR